MAGRIRLFQSLQNNQRLMGIYTIEFNQLAPFSFINVFFLLSFAHFGIPATLFFVFKANSFKDYAESSYAYMTGAANTCFYILQMIHITNLDTLIKKFEGFIEQSKWKLWILTFEIPFILKYISRSRSEHENAALRQIERHNRIIHHNTVLDLLHNRDWRDIAENVSILHKLFPTWFGTWIILSAISERVSDMAWLLSSNFNSRTQFIVLLSSSLEFDWKTPFGYLVAVLGQAVQVFCIVFNISPFLVFMFGSCLLFIAFVEDITNEFEDLSSIESSPKNDMELKKRFSYVIQLYSEVKQLSDATLKTFG